jgi:hypothetical protein
MTALGTAPIPVGRPTGPTAKVVELACYRTPSAGERVIRGQRVDGSVRLTDHPAHRTGRAFRIERGLEREGSAAMHKLITDYVDQVVLDDEISSSRALWIAAWPISVRHQRTWHPDAASAIPTPATSRGTVAMPPAVDSLRAAGQIARREPSPRGCWCAMLPLRPVSKMTRSFQWRWLGITLAAHR